MYYVCVFGTEYKVPCVDFEGLRSSIYKARTSIKREHHSRNGREETGLRVLVFSLEGR